MLNFIFIIILCILVCLLGIKIGITFVIDKLITCRKISIRDYKYFSSWNFIIKSIRDDI